MPKTADFTTSDAYGSGEISRFPGLTDRTRAYWRETMSTVRSLTETNFDGFAEGIDNGRNLFDDSVKQSFVSGHDPSFAARRFLRLVCGESARTLSVPQMDSRADQLFLQVGTAPENWGSATFTGEELHQELYRAEAEENVSESASWPEAPGGKFSPYEGLTVVRLR